MEFAGRKILVMGIARTGLAAAKVLKELGAEVFAVDDGNTSLLEDRVKELKELGVDCCLGPSDLSVLKGRELVIVSPGVPPKNPLIAEATKKGIPIWSEIELAFRLAKGPIIGITGTNGKTTTTILVGEIFKAAGRESEIAGNIGFPLIEAVHKVRPGSYLIAELSSFQLKYIQCFQPHVAVLLNLSCDHLDWHSSIEDYVSCKYKLFVNQGERDWAILNTSLLQLPSGKARRLFFGTLKKTPGVWCENGQIQKDFRGEEVLGKAKEIALIGEHNVQNSLAAAAIALTQEIDGETIMKVLQEFKGVEHRLESVRCWKDVLFYNDSKATNPEAVIVALRAFPQPIVLLAGGRNKGNSFDALAEEAKGRVKTAILFGEAAPEIEESFAQQEIRTKRANSLEDSVEMAKALASKGDVVLLSPACASFDAFENFEARGLAFKKAVWGL